MKPSPVLESIRLALSKQLAWRTDEDKTYANIVLSREQAAALLALISAQPGGEGVTREQIADAAELAIATITVNHTRPHNPKWAIADAIMELFRPTSPDPARAGQVPEREGK